MSPTLVIVSLPTRLRVTRTSLVAKLLSPPTFLPLATNYPGNRSWIRYYCPRAQRRNGVRLVCHAFVARGEFVCASMTFTFDLISNSYSLGIILLHLLSNSHAAEPGFVNHQFMEGQLVVIGGGDYFSFAWVPLEHQIFFGRPSPELTLKMLREGGGTSLTAGVGLVMPDLNSGVKEQREYVSRCLEVTCDALWEESTEGKVDPMSCIWHGDDDEYCYFE